MPDATPAPIATALDELKKAFRFDPLVAPWSEIAAAARASMRGEFDPRNPAHRLLQLRLGALFGARLARTSGAFWFRQRDAVGGFSLGFPDVTFTVSPFALAAVALIGNKIAALDASAQEVLEDRAATQARDGAAPQPLTPHDYERFFDPGLIEFLALDEQRAHRAWGTTPAELIRELKDAQLRTHLAKPTRDWVERDLISALRGLDGGVPLTEQAERAPRVIERTGELFAGRYGTGLTTEEGWLHAALPLLCVDPAAEPTLATSKKTRVLEQFLDTMPRRKEAPPSGILGLFEAEHVSAPHPKLARIASLRLVRINPRPALPLLQKFDPAKVRVAFEAFAKTAKASVSPQEKAVLDGSLDWLKRLQDTLALAIKDKLDFCLRRAPEQDGDTGGSKAELRGVLQG